MKVKNKGSKNCAPLISLSDSKALNGFTLLEIMVALAIMALSFTALFLVQGRATRLGSEARTISLATQLARYQLLECKKEAQKIIASASDFKLDGDFSELGFADFSWECHAPQFNMKAPSASQVDESIKRNTPDEQKQQQKASAASTMSPIITMVTDTLGNSVRELALIIRWNEGEKSDELRVVTHIVDLAAMQVLAKMLAEGARQFNTQKTPPKGPPQGSPGLSPPRGQR